MEKSNKKFNLENKITDIETLLENDDIKDFMDTENSTTSPEMDTDILCPNESTNPGKFEVTLDAMKMNLYLDLKAPINSSNEITILDIKSKVETYGSYCESCTDWERIHDLYTRIIHNGEILPKQLIGKGKPVSFNIPEHILLKEDLTSRKVLEADEHGYMDYHKVNSFILISKNQCLGTLVPEIPGTNGVNLLGEEIIAPKKIINLYKASKNIDIHKGKLYSTIDGAFKIVGHNVIVDDLIEIPGDVDYSTGDVTFKGDIKVNKTILEGFNVCSDGDIIVSESIEPTNITCGNNLIVNNGIIGNENHKVNVKNDIIALHAENANIDCLGSVVITNGIINSNINALGTLNVGKKATIIGGTYRIQNGIIAGNIGNAKGKQSSIYLGVDYTIQSKIIETQSNIVKLLKLSKDLQEKLKIETDRSEKNKIKILFIKVKNRLISLSNYSRALLYRLDKNENSTLTVWGTIRPRTYIEICHVSLIVDSELSHVRFSLDKINGCIKKEFL